MKKIIIFFAILTFSLFSNITSAQYDAKKHKTKIEDYFDRPFFTIDAKASFDISTMDLRGDGVKEFWNFKSYGMNEGYGGEIKFKMSVLNLKDSQLRTYLSIGYTHFVAEDNRAYVPDVWISPGWPKTGFNGTGTYTPSDTTGTSRLRMNMPYCALGMEYALYTDKKYRSSFNFGFDFNMTILWGKEIETYSYNHIFGPDTIFAGEEVEHNMNAQPRVGLGLSITYNYRFIETFGFNAGIRYHFVNMIGKNDSEADPTGKIYIMDKGDSSLSPLLKESRFMGYYKLFLGVSFFIGSM
jgi:hypothetical protein